MDKHFHVVNIHPLTALQLVASILKDHQLPGLVLELNTLRQSSSKCEPASLSLCPVLRHPAQSPLQTLLHCVFMMKMRYILLRVS